MKNMHFFNINRSIISSVVTSDIFGPTNCGVVPVRPYLLKLFCYSFLPPFRHCVIRSSIYQRSVFCLFSKMALRIFPGEFCIANIRVTGEFLEIVIAWNEPELLNHLKVNNSVIICKQYFSSLFAT